MTDREIFDPAAIARRLEEAKLAFVATNTILWSDAEVRAMSATAAVHGLRSGFRGIYAGASRTAGYKNPRPPGSD